MPPLHPFWQGLLGELKAAATVAPLVEGSVVAKNVRQLRAPSKAVPKIVNKSIVIRGNRGPAAYLDPAPK